MYQVIVVVVVFEVFTEFDMDFDLSTSHLLKKTVSSYYTIMKVRKREIPNLKDLLTSNQFQGVSQKIKTADVFLKVGNQPSVYQTSPTMVGNKKIFWYNLQNAEKHHPGK